MATTIKCSQKSKKCFTHTHTSAQCQIFATFASWQILLYIVQNKICRNRSNFCKTTRTNDKKLSYCRGTVRRSSHLKFCQLQHNCTKSCICKGLQQVNDSEGHSRSSEQPLFDTSYITSDQWFVITMSLCFAPFPRYYHFYSVCEPECLRPSEILQFQ